MATRTLTKSTRTVATKATPTKDNVTEPSKSALMAEAKRAEAEARTLSIGTLLTRYNVATDSHISAASEEAEALSIAERAKLAKDNAEVRAARAAFLIASHPEVMTATLIKRAVNHNKKVAEGEATDVWPENLTFTGAAKVMGAKASTIRVAILAGAALAKNKGAAGRMWADAEPTEEDRAIVAKSKKPEQDRKAKDEAAKREARNSEGEATEAEGTDSDALTATEVIAKLSAALGTLNVYAANGGKLTESEAAKLSTLVESYTDALAMTVAASEDDTDTED